MPRDIYRVAFNLDIGLIFEIKYTDILLILLKGLRRVPLQNKLVGYQHLIKKSPLSKPHRKLNASMLKIKRINRLRDLRYRKKKRNKKTKEQSKKKQSKKRKQQLKMKQNKKRKQQSKKKQKKKRKKQSRKKNKSQITENARRSKYLRIRIISFIILISLY